MWHLLSQARCHLTSGDYGCSGESLQHWLLALREPARLWQAVGEPEQRQIFLALPCCVVFLYSNIPGHPAERGFLGESLWKIQVGDNIWVIMANVTQKMLNPVVRRAFPFELGSLWRLKETVSAWRPTSPPTSSASQCLREPASDSQHG